MSRSLYKNETLKAKYSPDDVGTSFCIVNFGVKTCMCVPHQTSWWSPTELSKDPGFSEGIQQHPHDRKKEGEDGQHAHQLQTQFYIHYVIIHFIYCWLIYLYFSSNYHTLSSSYTLSYFSSNYHQTWLVIFSSTDISIYIIIFNISFLTLVIF